MRAARPLLLGVGWRFTDPGGGTDASRLTAERQRPDEFQRPLALEWIYGHFTAMQLRGGRTRGLQLHLDRLGAASREMFGAALEGGQVRDLIRHALGARVRDASVHA